MNQTQIDDDQAGFIGDIFDLHLQKHGGVPDKNCSFCKGFIIHDNPEPFSSYEFVIFDISPDKE